MKLLWIFLAAMFAAEPAHAGPIATAIGAAVAWIGTAFAAGGFFTTVIGQIVLSVGMSLLSKALQKKPKYPGVSFDVEVGDDRPLSFIIGRYASAGRRKYAGTWGSNNGYYVEVIELSNIPVSALSAVFIDGERHDFVAGVDPKGAAYAPAAGAPERIWIKFYDGTQSAADAYLVEKFGAHQDRPWGVEMVGRGTAYAILTLQHDSANLTNRPEVLFEIDGIKCYDVRKDSTVGGSGSHRWGDPSTWEHTLNGAVISYNVARGIYYGSEWIFGGQNFGAWRFPASAWMAAANACDEAVALASGGTEAAYRVGLEVSVDLDPGEVIQQIGLASNMQFAEVGGRLKPVVGPTGSAVYSFSDENLIVTDAQGLAPFPSLDQTFNAILATYPEPLEGWKNKDAAEYRDAVLVADDGRYLPASMGYAAAPYPLQVQRLMRSQLLDYRRFRTHQISLPPEAYALEPLDVVSWTSARNGYVDKKFRVTSVAKKKGFSVSLTLREIDPSDYDWSSSYERSVETGWIGAVERPAVSISWFTAAGVTIIDAAGGPRLPAIQVGAESGEFGAVAVQVQALLDGVVVYDGERPYDPDAAEWVSILPMQTLPATAYLVRGRFVTRSTAESEWSNYIAVLTPDVRFTSGDLADEINNAISQAREEADAARAAADAATTKADAALADLSWLSPSFTALAGDVSGNSSAITLLGARVDTVDGELSAQAGSITTLSAQLGAVEATASTQSIAIATLEGNAAATLSFRAKAGSSGALLELVATDGPSGVASVARIEATNILLDGSVYAQHLAANSVLAQHISVASLDAISANLGSIQVGSANIATAAVDTLKIAGYAVTFPQAVVGSPTSGYINGTHGLVTIATLNVNGSGAPARISGGATITHANDDQVSIYRTDWTRFEIGLYLNGSLISGLTNCHVDGYNNPYIRLPSLRSVSGSATIELKLKCLGGTAAWTKYIQPTIEYLELKR